MWELCRRQDGGTDGKVLSLCSDWQAQGGLVAARHESPENMAHSAGRGSLQGRLAILASGVSPSHGCCITFVNATLWQWWLAVYQSFIVSLCRAQWEAASQAGTTFHRQLPCLHPLKLGGGMDWVWLNSGQWIVDRSEQATSGLAHKYFPCFLPYPSNLLNVRGSATLQASYWIWQSLSQPEWLHKATLLVGNFMWEKYKLMWNKPLKFQGLFITTSTNT